MGKKCVCIILGVLWLPAFLLFLLSVFFAGLNQMSDIALTDELKGKMEGTQDTNMFTQEQVKNIIQKGMKVPVNVEVDDAIKVPDTIPSFILDGAKLEVEVSWKENCWIGIVSEEEQKKKNCGHVKLPVENHKNCVAGDMAYAGGGPDSASERSFTFEVQPGTWYIAGGALEGGGTTDGKTRIDVMWKVHLSVVTSVQVICSIACVVLGVFLISPCILCCCWKGKQDG